MLGVRPDTHVVKPLFDSIIVRDAVVGLYAACLKLPPTESIKP